MSTTQIATTERPRLGHLKSAAPKQRRPTNPPVVTTPVEHPIFGKMPPDFDLNKQPVPMLFYWLKKARAEVDAVFNLPPDDYTDEKGTAALEPFNRIFAALIDAEVCCVSDVERQMLAVVNYIDWFNSDAVDEAINIGQFQKIAANLQRVNAPKTPRKLPGKLARGGKLTRAGLLFRYCSFLIEEIHTVSLELYGDPRFALGFVKFDDAVRKALKSKNASKVNHVFLDPTTLTVRANTVLKALKVDRANDDVYLRMRGAR